MEKQLKIATWNLCLGLSNKKDTVLRYLSENEIKICCLQETEIPLNFPENVLNCGNYNLELEMNTDKKRAGIYIRSDVKYIRRNDLENGDRHLVIIDVLSHKPIRIINVYRSFRPQGGISPEAFFLAQLDVIKKALTKNCFVMGDFNLDVNKEARSDYAYKVPFSHLSDFVTDNNLIQLIDFPTWSRTINGIRKESILDHVYVNNCSLVNNLTSIEPTFGDHLLIVIELNLHLDDYLQSYVRRDWKNYSKTSLIQQLKIKNYEADGCVQSNWNAIEESLIMAADIVAPLCNFVKNVNPKKGPMTTVIIIIIIIIMFISFKILNLEFL